MDDLSLAHSRYNCTYHIVFIPNIVEKRCLESCVEKWGKYLVKYAEWKKYNRHFWVREYYCETIGDVNEETIKRYIREQ